MKRLTISPRLDWEDKIKQGGLTYSQDGPSGPHYWNEMNCYQLSLTEEQEFIKAGKDAHAMAMEAVKYFTTGDNIKRLHLNEYAEKIIKKSWERNEPSYYGRFDFYSTKDGLKLLEYNADTPTGVPESAVVQKARMDDHILGTEHHTNTLYSDMVNRWGELLEMTDRKILHMACVDTLGLYTLEEWPEEDRPNMWEQEDEQNILLHAKAAAEAGWDVRLIHIDDVLWDHKNKVWYEESQTEEEYSLDEDSWTGDPERHSKAQRTQITSLFKIYPWEDMVFDDYGKILAEDGGYEAMEHWFEPAWKMCLSTKMLLPVLWELFPDHPLLAWSYDSTRFNPRTHRDYVKKPIFGREGDGIEIHAPSYGVYVGNTDGWMTEATPKSDYIYQDFVASLEYDGYIPMIGVWRIGDADPEKGSIPTFAIRDSKEKITDYYCLFTPHFTLDA